MSAPLYDLYIFTIYGQIPLKWGLCYPEVCSQTLKTAIRTTIGSVIEFQEPVTDDFGELSDNMGAKIAILIVVGLLAILGIIGMIV